MISMAKGRTSKKQNRKYVIGIIGGTGLLGRTFAKFFRKHNHKVLIAGRKTKLNYGDLAEKCDVVIFSLPISVTPKIIKKIRKKVRANQLLMDFTSVKRDSVKEMMKSKASVIGLHPMFGKVESLKGKTIIVIPARINRNEEWMTWLLYLFKKGNVKVKVTTPENHDKIMAVLQGLMHFNFIVMSKTLREIEKKYKINLDELIDFGGIIYKLRYEMISRILNNEGEMHADISIKNKTTNTVLKEYEKQVKQLRKIIGRENKK